MATALATWWAWRLPGPHKSHPGPARGQHRAAVTGLWCDEHSVLNGHLPPEVQPPATDTWPRAEDRTGLAAASRALPREKETEAKIHSSLHTLLGLLADPTLSAPRATVRLQQWGPQKS